MTSPSKQAGFRERVQTALGDEVLHGALRNATDLFAERRRAAIASIDDWQGLRDHARAIKDDVISHLDQHLEAFADKAEARGLCVHWAEDATQACTIIADLALRSNNGKPGATVVKAKSMTGEEIDLNEALEAKGHDPIETDLGEYIIQLAGETPSHIIVPAIHKTKQQIADLFTAKLGIEPTDDERKLCATARKILRTRFAESDLGVSGVNFAIAETGSILVLENEGNIRMSTTLPKIHVAIMGIEKVIPKFDDLAVFLRLLPRSGTGQHLTTYQSILTGPVKEDREGPREIHIVLLDNGRSKLLENEHSKQTLACIRCGACLNACPVYQQIGGHAYGSVYPGPIGAILTPQLEGLAQAEDLPFASSLCGACRDVCPVKIDIPEVILDLRARIVEASTSTAKATHDRSDRTRPRKFERLAFRIWAMTFSKPILANLAYGMARLGQGLRLHRLLPPVRAWTKTRELRQPPATSFRQAMHKRSKMRGDS